jgi:uncharacterized phage protein gp47/JayE
MAYIDIPIVTDTKTLTDNARAFLSNEGWETNEGDPEVVIIQSVAPAAQAAAVTASQVFAAIFRRWGTDVLGVPYRAGVAAEGTVTFLLADTLGMTIPAGTAMRFGGQDFTTVEVTTVPPGPVSYTGVLVRAVEAGAKGNGLSGPGKMVDLFVRVTGVVLEGVTSGGDDAQSDEEYISDLRSHIRTGGRPITDENFASLAMSTPDVGVGRATAVTTAPRTVKVVVCDIEGEPLTQNDKDAVSAYLRSMRETNFIVPVIDPSYNDMVVSYAYAIKEAYIAETVEADINLALLDYFSAATWGLPEVKDPFATEAVWSNQPFVRMSQLITAMQNVPGVAFVQDVTVNGSEDDFALVGIGPLPRLVEDDITATLVSAAVV